MNFLTASVLSGIVYDLLKRGLSLSLENLKSSLKKWFIDDDIIAKLSKELENINVTNRDSESVIEEKIKESKFLINFLSNMPQNPSYSVSQHHSGSGDNISGHTVNIHKK